MLRPAMEAARWCLCTTPTLRHTLSRSVTVLDWIGSLCSSAVSSPVVDSSSTESLLSVLGLKLSPSASRSTTNSSSSSTSGTICPNACKVSMPKRFMVSSTLAGETVSSEVNSKSGSRKPIKNPRCLSSFFRPVAQLRLPNRELSKARRRSTMNNCAGTGSSCVGPVSPLQGRSNVTGSNFTGGASSRPAVSSIARILLWSSRLRYSVIRSPRILRPMTISRCRLLVSSVSPSAATQKVIASHTMANNASKASFSVASPNWASYKSLQRRCCCNAPYTKMNGHNMTASAKAWLSRNGVSPGSYESNAMHTDHAATTFATLTKMHMEDCIASSPVNCRKINDQAKSPNMRLTKSSWPSNAQNNKAWHNI
mmetsp:Transcript_79922/g.232004  ORF Transcript_79922/g.232004 Transcript_79922/m.232004 type:complete len:368 (-) Transcript_79922:410-1513(-)